MNNYHFSLGAFNDAAHSQCNLLYKLDPRQWKCPVLFHNLKGYDGHFIINGATEKHGEIRVIPTNFERFMSFSIGRLQFLDSFQFTQQSLEKLAKTLKDEDFVYTRKEFSIPEQFRLLTKKGVYPYDYVTSIHQLESDEPIEFPRKDLFFNKVNDEHITDEEYTHGKTVFETCCPNRTLREYHDVYLKSDILLLADFFEKYRKMCLDYYKLDPVHYYTAPGNLSPIAF